jgi:hypothetical protein
MTALEKVDEDTDWHKIIVTYLGIRGESGSNAEMISALAADDQCALSM